MTIKTIADLTPDPRNARAHTPRNVGMIETALGEVGAARSIVIDEDGVVLAGNATIEAAAAAGIERVQVVDADGETIIAVRRSGLTAEQKTKLALFDNRAAELAEWDAGVLAGLAEELDLSGLFRDEELQSILAELEPEAQPQDDDAPAIDEGKPTRCQPGDVWRVGPHLIACLDSTEPGNLDRLVRGRKVGMVWSDAPYGINAVENSPRLRELGYTQIANDATTETARAAVALCLSEYKDAVHVWWGGNYFADTLPPSRGWIVWDKDHHGMDFADAELAWCNAAHPVRCFRHAWSGADRDSEKGEARVHPNQKPVALAIWAFSRYGASGDLILDPFLGSGPSLKAAHRMGDRTVVGFELSPAYCDHILEWAEAEGLTVERAE